MISLLLSLLKLSYYHFLIVGWKTISNKLSYRTNIYIIISQTCMLFTCTKINLDFHPPLILSTTFILSTYSSFIVSMHSNKTSLNLPGERLSGRSGIEILYLVWILIQGNPLLMPLLLLILFIMPLSLFSWNCSPF